MGTTTLYIKNMVCDRCKRAVRNALEELGLDTESVELGIARVAGDASGDRLDDVRRSLRRLGFELLEDRQKRTVDRIKSAIIELVHYNDSRSCVNLSVFLADRLKTDYSSLSKLFSESTGITIERYLILQRVERVKELIFYDELSLSKIAVKMNYSSVGYLSTQFKNVTGMTPTQFRAMRKKELKELDKI